MDVAFVWIKEERGPKEILEWSSNIWIPPIENLYGELKVKVQAQKPHHFDEMGFFFVKEGAPYHPS